MHGMMYNRNKLGVYEFLQHLVTLGRTKQNEDSETIAFVWLQHIWWNDDSHHMKLKSK